MRNISVIIDQNGNVTLGGQMLGYGGEHNASVITVSFDSSGYERYSALDYFRIVIDGKYSEDLYFENQTISYTVPQIAMQPPEVQCQVLGYKIQDGEPSVIMKSNCFKLLVDCSEVCDIEAKNEPDILEKTVSLCTEAALSVKKSLEEVNNAVNIVTVTAESVESNSLNAEMSARDAEMSAQSAAESAKVLGEIVLDRNNISNALRGYGSGKEVQFSDVSPLQHNVNVQLLSKNKYNPENTFGGYIGEDGVIVADQTATLVYAECEPNEVYTVSKISGQSFSVQFSGQLPQEEVKTFGKIENSTASSITVTAPFNAKYIVALVYNGNLDIAPTREEMLDSVQIEKGNMATEYTQYVDFNSGCITLVENKIYEDSSGSGSIGVFEECQSVKNLTFKANTVETIVLRPCIRGQGTYVSLTVDSSFGAVDITYTIDGQVISWNGTKSVLDAEGNVLSTEQVSGSYTVDGLLDSESYFTGWFVQGYGYDENLKPKCVATVTSRDSEPVTVLVGGKNLLNLEDFITEYNAAKTHSHSAKLIDYDFAECVQYRAHCDAMRFMQGQFKENTQYTFTMKAYCVFSNLRGAIMRIFYTDGTYTDIVVLNNQWNDIVLITDANKTIDYITIAGYSTTAVVYIATDWQIEEGTVSTEYEPYIAPIEYIPADDGSLALQSKYPSTRITTDNDGVIISAQYNIDLNKVMDRLYNAATLLGGTV